MCHDNEVPLQVIGDGSLREEFERKFYRIKFLGQVGNRAINRVRATRAVFVPTPLEYSMTVLEAFSQGTPVIGIRCDATEELLERRETAFGARLGVIYESNSPEDIGTALNILNQDYHLFDAKLIADSTKEFSPEAFHSWLKKFVLTELRRVHWALWRTKPNWIVSLTDVSLQAELQSTTKVTSNQKIGRYHLNLTATDK